MYTGIIDPTVNDKGLVPHIIIVIFILLGVSLSIYRIATLLMYLFISLI